uniref:MYND-type domain-containing protein n=1 Tax=Attheya septentrionalis TaxID=420275 RepID=A0A7S2XP86_9STRA|mmetsp:Transcript_17770/g.32163  ORF Transcript_17770/g.32163 Transcript_17770/m.32163 type:complete len:284 (+) Transcript_17770:132-983(+)
MNPELEEAAAYLNENPALVRAIEQVLLLPPSSTQDQSLDCFTCSLCSKISVHKLPCCRRCKKQAYCNKKCQRDHWKRGGHKQDCVAVETLSEEEKRSLPLTWKQLEAFGSADRKVLEIRISSVLYNTQGNGNTIEAMCYDRAKECRRVLMPAGIEKMFSEYICLSIKWKNPIFRSYTFEDRSNEKGVVIEKEDIKNIELIHEGLRVPIQNLSITSDQKGSSDIDDLHSDIRSLTEETSKHWAKKISLDRYIGYVYTYSRFVIHAVIALGWKIFFSPGAVRCDH